MDVGNFLADLIYFGALAAIALGGLGCVLVARIERKRGRRRAR